MPKLLFLKKKKLKKLKNAKLLVLLTFINLLMYDYYITFFSYLSIVLLKNFDFFIFHSFLHAYLFKYSYFTLFNFIIIYHALSHIKVSVMVGVMRILA